MKEPPTGKLPVLSEKEIEDLLSAITTSEDREHHTWLWVQIEKAVHGLKRKKPKHLINTGPDEADLPGVSQIWFNDEIQIPIWTDAQGNVCAFRIYPEQMLRLESQAPFLEWSLKHGYASSKPAPSLRWVKRQFYMGSVGGFGQMQDWGDVITRAIQEWPRKWERKYEITDRALHLAQ